MKYKIVEEYEKFYVTEAPAGYKECFLKREYSKDDEGYIHQKKLVPVERPPIDPKKINKSFNEFGSLKR